MNKQLSVLVRKPRESMPLIETESSTPTLSKTKALGKLETSKCFDLNDDRYKKKYFTQRLTNKQLSSLCAFNHMDFTRFINCPSTDCSVHVDNREEIKTL